jgi:hypothetical protein
MVRKRPYINDWKATPVGDAFKYLTKYKKHYILKNPDGSLVSLADAIRNFQKDGDLKWPLHVMMSNLGYIANGIARAVGKFGLDIEDYITDAFEGVCNAMLKCDPERAKMAYIGSGVFFAVRKAAYKAIREKEKIETLQVEDADGEPLDDDRLAAIFGIYQVNAIFETCSVYLTDEDLTEDKVHTQRKPRRSSSRT